MPKNLKHSKYMKETVLIVQTIVSIIAHQWVQYIYICRTILKGESEICEYETFDTTIRQELIVK